MTTETTPVPLTRPPHISHPLGAYRVWTAAHGLPLDQVEAPLFVELDGWSVAHVPAGNGVILRVVRYPGPPAGGDGQAGEECHQLNGTGWPSAAAAREALFAAGVLGVKVLDTNADTVRMAVWQRFGRGYSVRDRQLVLVYSVPRALRREAALDAVRALTQPRDDAAEVFSGGENWCVRTYHERGYRPVTAGDLVEYDGTIYECGDDGWRALSAKDLAEQGPSVEPLPGQDSPAQANGHMVIATAELYLIWVPERGRWEVCDRCVDGLPLETTWASRDNVLDHEPDCDDPACDEDSHLAALRAVERQVGYPSGAEVIAAIGARVLQTEAHLDTANGVLKTLFDTAMHSPDRALAELVLEAVFGCRFSHDKPEDPPGSD